LSSLPWSAHSVIVREVVFEGYLVAESPLRIGVGRISPLGSAADLAVLRVNLNGKLVPYIPGSSLKGVFRSTAIQLANLAITPARRPLEYAFSATSSAQPAWPAS